MIDALELEVERAYVALSNAYRPRTMFLTRAGLPWRPADGLVEVGTYTKAVPLADFREDVFFAFEQSKGRRCGRTR